MSSGNWELAARSIRLAPADATDLERLSNSGDEQRARHQLLSYQLEELENGAGRTNWSN